MHEARFYEKVGEGAVRCLLCPNQCLIRDGKFGSCRSRKNVAGVLMAVNYARTVSLNLDPIEKKPLYHYYPGSQILSLGANSCNLHCQFCQNFEISQEDCPTRVLSPEDLLDILLRKHQNAVAFTYTEPFTWYEYIYDCGKLLTPKGIKLVLVTNGYIEQEPLRELLPYVDAMNIDLKSIRPEFHQKICAGKLDPVLATIRTAAQACHVELTNLLIPGLNDSEEEIRDLVGFVAEVDRNIPLHFSRYYPRWQCELPATPESTLFLAYGIAAQKLNYVYLGNIASGEHSDTHCPNCQAHLISRSFLSIDTHFMQGDKCSKCGFKIYGRFAC